MTKQKIEHEETTPNPEGVLENAREVEDQGIDSRNREADKLKKLEQYKKAASSGKTLVSGSEYWDFEAEPYFVGRWTERYAKREKRPKDKPEEIGEDGKVIIGLIFESELDGEEWIIGNSYAVTKALKILEKDGDVTVPILIEFKGKTETADGQPYNNFHIVAL